MSSEWEEVKIEDISEMKYGKMPNKIKIRETGYPIFTGYRVAGYYDEYMFEEPQLVVVARGVGGTGDVKISPPRAYITNLSIILMINELKINKKYLYYKLGLENLRMLDSGSAQSQITIADLKRYKIEIPPLKEQKAIAHILSTLDEKIESNNQINKKLEEMAQTIFKHWFVDFEFPNEDGEPYKSSGGGMVESELGMIPKGWEVRTIEELGDVIGGATPSKKKEEYFVEKGIPWITPKDLSENKSLFISRGALDITEEAYSSTSVRKMPQGTVLFSSRAPIGYIAISKNEITTNQGFKSIVPATHRGFSSKFIYCWLKQNLDVIENRASGSTFKEISGSEMKKIPAIIPPKSILDKFKNISSDVFKKIEIKELENRKLAGIRDLLLAKLMSGEIRVPLEEGDI